MKKKLLIFSIMSAFTFCVNSYAQVMMDDGGGEPGYYFQCCTQSNGKVGGECTTAVGNCSSWESCG